MPKNSPLTLLPGEALGQARMKKDGQWNLWMWPQSGTEEGWKGLSGWYLQEKDTWIYWGEQLGIWTAFRETPPAVDGWGLCAWGSTDPALCRGMWWIQVHFPGALPVCTGISPCGDSRGWRTCADVCKTRCAKAWCLMMVQWLSVPLSLCRSTIAITKGNRSWHFKASGEPGPPACCCWRRCFMTTISYVLEEGGNKPLLNWKTCEKVTLLKSCAF